jgi:hypothetical protein
MAKRFTDTDLWKKQRWFRKLNPLNKLVFCYIKDLCNHAGIWKVECSDLIDDLGLDEFDINQFIEAVNTEFDKITGKKILKERLLLLSDNILWISGFVQFQYEGKDGKVNPDAAPVRTALLCLQGLRIPSVTLAHPLHKSSTVLEYALTYKHISLTKDLAEGWTTPKDKDKDKDKDKKGGAGENKQTGIRFSDDNSSVIFPDGRQQRLGVSQRGLLEMGKLKPKEVYEGLIH